MTALPDSSFILPSPSMVPLLAVVPRGTPVWKWTCLSRIHFQRSHNQVQFAKQLSCSSRSAHSPLLVRFTGSVEQDKGQRSNLYDGSHTPHQSVISCLGKTSAGRKSTTSSTLSLLVRGLLLNELVPTVFSDVHQNVDRSLIRQPETSQVACSGWSTIILSISNADISPRSGGSNGRHACRENTGWE